MDDFNEKLNEITDTPDTTAEFDPEDIQNNKFMGILAYFSLLVLIPLFGAKESKFARFHCNQGIVLAIAELVSSILLGRLARLHGVGFIFGILEAVIDIACAVFAIMGIINAAKGEAKELPVIGKFRILK